MSRIPSKRLILVLLCFLVAMLLGWRGARLSMRAVDGEVPQSSDPVAEVHERTAATTDEAGTDDEDPSSGDDGSVLRAEVDEAGEGDGGVENAPGPFVIPEGVEYEPDVVLVGLADGVTASDLEVLLAETDEIATKAVSADEVARGIATLEVAEGYSVEDAVNALLGNELIDIVQPNYVYHAMLGDGQDLRGLLAASNEPQVEPLDPVVDESDGPEERSEGETEEPSYGNVGQDEPEEDVTLQDETADDAPGDERRLDEDRAVTSAEDGQAQEGDADQGDSAPDGRDEAQAGDGDTPGETTLQALLDVNDPYSSSSSSSQWALSSIKAYAAWSIARCEGSVTVAVLDQLPDAAHEDLAGNVVDTYDAHDASSTATITTPRNHGTHVAGIVSGVANNGIGVAGVSYNAGLLLVNVFNSSLQSSTTDLIRAYDWVMERASQHNVRVINLSLGGPVSDTYSFSDDLFLRSVDKARDDYGIVTVAAAANADSNGGVVPFREYPGDADSVVSVINLRQSGTGVTRNSSSNYNLAGQTGKNISAPGTDVMSTLLNDTYGTMSGTSMAAPQVAGVLALEFAANESLTADEAVAILYSSALDLGDAGWDEGYGYGEVDALAAVLGAAPLGAVSIELSPSEFTYSGEPCEPDVVVRVGDVVLAEGTDYTVSYANNVNVGTATAAVVINSGDLSGYTSTTFTIGPASLSDAKVSLSKSSYSYTGSAIKPGVSVELDGVALAVGTDYTVSYSDNEGVGTAVVTVKGRGNYTGTASATFEIVSSPLVEYRAHVQNVGWQGWRTNGAMAGTSGESLRLEAIEARLGASVGYSGSIQYRTHIQNVGWESAWRSDGATSGTSGKGLRLEAIQILLSGEVAQHYDVYYRVHAQSLGWLGWAKNGESAGTAGYSYRLEAIQIQLVKKGGDAPGPTSSAFWAKMVSYRTHVQNVGWQPYVYDGATSGTSGRSLRLEGINIQVGSLGYSGSIQYRTHVQNIGWQGWKSDGAMSGTSGRSLRLEAVEVKLTGELSERYDVYYRVHAQNIGWMGWAKNGASAGTAGYSYRLEAIQIVLVPKGGMAPGSTSGCFRQR